jgi:alkylation response protein AidB-like acyl-CoA dehydrogenase
MAIGHAALDAARQLRPVLREHRPQADAQAHMAPVVKAALTSAGMFRLVAPVEVGGLEVPLHVMAAVLEELAGGDPGAAWHLANSPMAGYVAAYLDAPARERIFASPGFVYSFSAMPSGTARRVDGGYRVTGRWPFITGIRDADWAVLTGMIREGEEPPHPRNVRFFMIRPDQLTVEDTWSKAAAMRSSGSNAARAEDVFVEDALVYAHGQPRLIDRSLYRIPAPLFFVVSAAAIAIGVLRGAIEAATASASTKVSSWTGADWSSQVTVRQAVARASAVHHCCRAGLLTALEEVQQRYETAETIPASERAITWATAINVGDQARAALSSLTGVATSQSFITGHPFEIAVSDIHAILMSFEAPRIFEDAAGGVMLGLKPSAPGF